MQQSAPSRYGQKHDFSLPGILTEALLPHHWDFPSLGGLLLKAFEIIFLPPNLCSQSANSCRLPVTHCYQCHSASLIYEPYHLPVNPFNPTGNFVLHHMLSYSLSNLQNSSGRSGNPKAFPLLKSPSLDCTSLFWNLAVSSGHPLKSFPLRLPSLSPPPPIILLSSEHLNFWYHCKIYCINLDLTVSGSAAQTTPASKSCFSLFNSAQLSHV